MIAVETSRVVMLNNKGLSRHPCGEPVPSVIILDVMLPTLTACRLSVRKQVFNELFCQDCIKSRAELAKQPINDPDNVVETVCANQF